MSPQVAISPRRLEAQARYLTIRFGTHARRWQLVLWLRQLTLFAISTVLDVLTDVMHANNAALHDVDHVCYSFAGAALVALMISLFVHHRTQPYVAFPPSHFPTSPLVGLAATGRRL